MPSYTIQIANKEIVGERPDVLLADDQEACAYAIQFASDLFRSHWHLCSGEWHLCSLQVLADGEEPVFETTIGRAAIIEREGLQHQAAHILN